MTLQLQDRKTFDIRNHVEKLQATGEKNRYICPCCGGNNFTINEDNGAYQCWNGCEPADIRNAIAPLEGKRHAPLPRNKHDEKPKKKYKPAPIPEGAKLLTSKELGDIPPCETLTSPPAGVPKAQRKYVYHYSKTQWVCRFEWEDSTKPKGYDKTFRQYHRNENGVIIGKKGDQPWNLYRIDEILAHINNVEFPALLWGEGEKCVEIARLSGILSTTLQGSNWNVPRIKEGLKPIASISPQCVQVFIADSDETGQKKGEKFEKACAEVGLPCVIIHTDKVFEISGDIEEVLESMDTPEFIKRLESELHHKAQRDLEKLKAAFEEVPEIEHPGIAKCKMAQKYNLIAAAWGHRLRWNNMKRRVELDGSPLPLDGIKLRIALEFDIDVNRENAVEIILSLAKKNEYSPFKEYLEALPNGDPEFLNSLASRFLGTHDPLHQALLKRTLIAAVARTYQPGCKHDTICILKGKQGAFKSTFWSVLAGKENFTDDLSGTDKDEILKLSRYTMIEFSEFETAYRKKEVSALKAFLSRESDSIRVPYGRDVQEVLRPSIFVGTTNKPEFLHDPTGERRYWAVPVKCDRIDIPQLKIDRDAIWSAAKAAYLAGEQWWLTSSEDEMLKASNSDFASTDVWEEVISGYISLQSETSVREILSECLKIDVSMQNRASQMRVAEILTRLGWVKGKKKKKHSRTIQCWNKIPQFSILEETTEVVTEVATKVATTSNEDISMHTENDNTTVTTFSSNLEINETENLINDQKNNSSSQQSFERVGRNQGSENVQVQSGSSFNKVVSSEVTTFENVNVGSTVYPLCGKYQGKECKVSAISDGAIWAYPISKQLGVPAVDYCANQLSFHPPVAMAKEKKDEAYQPSINWEGEEYLENLDD
ncbi:MAG: VapE domain-containing protein [Cyanobacteria bacterium P01_D01_bin.50]